MLGSDHGSSAGGYQQKDDLHTGRFRALQELLIDVSRANIDGRINLPVKGIPVF